MSRVMIILMNDAYSYPLIKIMSIFFIFPYGDCRGHLEFVGWFCEIWNTVLWDDRQFFNLNWLVNYCLRTSLYMYIHTYIHTRDPYMHLLLHPVRENKHVLVLCDDTHFRNSIGYNRYRELGLIYALISRSSINRSKLHVGFSVLPISIWDASFDPVLDCLQCVYISIFIISIYMYMICKSVMCARLSHCEILRRLHSGALQITMWTLPFIGSWVLYAYVCWYVYIWLYIIWFPCVLCKNALSHCKWHLVSLLDVYRYAHVGLVTYRT